jgi:hypothetical protein
MPHIKAAELCQGEREDVVREVGEVLNGTNRLAFESGSYLTPEEAGLCEAANMIMGLAYEKIAKRLKVKIK